MDISFYLFYGLLFAVAFLYSIVGHGGASGYLALMALYNFSPEIMKPTALVLNLFVSIITFIQFYRAKHFRESIFIPLALASVPMAFLGGMISLDAVVYKKILGLLLLIPIIRFLFFKLPENPELKEPSLKLAIFISAFVGLISGMIGIGGGILISPILLFLKWTDQKQTAAISALYIFVNSLAGLTGLFTKGIEMDSKMYVYVLIAIAGGMCGAYFGAMKFKQTVLKNILTVVLLLAAYKLLFTNA